MRPRQLATSLLLALTLTSCVDLGEGPPDDSAPTRKATGAAISTPELQWLDQFGGQPSVNGPDVSSDFASAVDADGAVYVVGATTGALPNQFDDRRPDAFLRKYDVNGDEVWTRQLELSEIEEATDVVVDATGVYVAGVTTFASARFGSMPRGFVSRFNADGDEIWTETVFIDDSSHVRINAIALDATGVYFAGEIGASTGRFEPAEPLDAFVRKIDRDATILWTDRFDAAGNESATSVTVGDTGVYVAGYTDAALPGQADAGARDAFVRRYDSAGMEQWTAQFGTAQNDVANGIVSFDTAVYVVGSTEGALPGQSSSGDLDGFVRKLAADGSTQWTHQFGTSAGDDATAVDANADGAFVAGSTAGAFAGQTNAGGLDSYARRLDPDGNPVWTFQIGSASNDWSFGLAADNESVYVAGSTDGAMPGESNSGGRDAYIYKLGDEADSDPGDPDPGDPECVTVEGDVIINQLADTDSVDDIEGCFDVTGGVFVQDTSGIVDLDFLADLRSVGGYLAITDNSDLVSTVGLESLRDVGEGLVIEGNANLQRINRMVSLQTVAGPVHIFGNSSLELIDFRDLASAGAVILAGNDALSSVGLCALETAAGLRVENNDALIDICLDQLRQVDGTLRVAYNQSLTGLDVRSLDQVDGDLVILHNVSLPTCEAESVGQSVGASNVTGTIVIAENDDTAICS